MEHIEEQEVCTINRVVTQITCDICGVLLDEPIYSEWLSPNDLQKGFKPISYFEIDVYVEYLGDRETEHICPKCIHQHIEKMIEKINRKPDIRSYKIRPTVGHLRK